MTATRPVRTNGFSAIGAKCTARAQEAPGRAALFDRFEQEAGTIYPRVESQIKGKSGTLNLQSLLAGLRIA